VIRRENWPEMTSEKRRLLRISNRAPRFPVVGGGWITRARKIPYTRAGRRGIGLPARKGIGDLQQPIAGQHRGSTSAIQTALNCLVAN